MFIPVVSFGHEKFWSRVPLLTPRSNHVIPAAQPNWGNLPQFLVLLIGSACQIGAYMLFVQSQCMGVEYCLIGFRVESMTAGVCLVAARYVHVEWSKIMVRLGIGK